MRLFARRWGLPAALALGIILQMGALPAAEGASSSVTAPFLPGSSAREPISVDAAKLDYFEKEQKLVYSGGVVARQGETTLKGSTITIYLDKSDSAQPSGPVPGANAQIRRMDVVGPVTVTQKDQVGMGDNASYEKAENKIYLIGHVSLSQGPNVVKGDKLVYDLTTGNANVQGERVTSLFTPGAGTEPGAKPKTPPAAQGPAAQAPESRRRR